MKKEIANHKLFYILLGGVLLIALLLRIYRLDSTLGFYYDQGRDAKVIWDFWHEGKLFLIGPTTGIAGIFRGPFYYYLIAPFYLIGNGDPVLPATFLGILATIAVLVMYIIGKKIGGRPMGLIAAVLGAFSFPVIQSSRWLSNPTPMLLLSMLLIWQMIELSVEKKRTHKTDLLWVGITFISGLSLFHFGSSGEFFYFLGLAVFTTWQRKKLPNWKWILASIGAFLFTALPLIAFDLKHDNILSNNIRSFISGDETFKTSFTEVLQDRFELYYGVFIGKLFQGTRLKEQILLVILGLSFLTFIPKIVKDNKAFPVLIMVFAPIMGFLFFQGNEGNIYDYYFTGYYLIFLLLVGIVLGFLWKSMLGKIFVILFLFFFITWNFNLARGYVNAKVDNEQVIMFDNQRQAIEWIYSDANGEPFNVDVYVPPVIPHAYDYLFRWYESKEEYNGLTEELLPRLYTLYEVDPPHPDRLQAWMDRQAGIGEVVNEQSFGGITVQRRARL